MRTRALGRFSVLGLMLLVGLTFSRPAEAKGTYFLLELNSGIGESAYAGGGGGLQYGAAAGVTLRIPRTPLRYHLLGTVAIRGGTESGFASGSPFVVNRSDVDLFAANRLVVPVWRMIRLYGEVGLGTRFTTSTVDRADGGPLTERQQRFLLVTAVGLQARLAKHFSVGVRWELIPVGAGPDLATFASNLEPNKNRISGLAQLGVHF